MMWLGFLLCWCVASATLEPTLVVGAVSSTSARILADTVDDQGVDVVVYRVDDAKSTLEELQRSETLLKKTHGVSPPHVLQLKGLMPDTHYYVQFGANNVNDGVDFVTLDASGSAKNASIGIISCDNARSDRDERLLQGLQNTIETPCSSAVNVREAALCSRPTLGTKLGLGDQLYNDDVFNLSVRLELNQSQAVPLFRKAYADAWGGGSRPLRSRQFWYRRGATYFLPDDHDIRNNLIPAHFEQRRTKHAAEAGLQVLREFQLRLLGAEWGFGDGDDMVIDLGGGGGGGLENGLPRGLGGTLPHFSVTIGSVGFVAVDIRVEQAFRNDGNLVSREQLSKVLEAVRDLNMDASVDQIVVLTSVPLLVVDRWLSWGPKILQNDEYPAHWTNAAHTAAILNAVGSSPKPVTLIAGDVHMSIRGSVCSNGFGDWFSTPARITGSEWWLSWIQWFEPLDPIGVTKSFGRSFEEWEEGWKLIAQALETDASMVSSVIMDVLANNSIRPSSLLTVDHTLRNAVSQNFYGNATLSKTTCMPSFVASGASSGASVLSTPRFALFAALVRSLSRPFAGMWSGSVDDVYGANNAIVLDPSASLTLSNITKPRTKSWHISSLLYSTYFPRWSTLGIDTSDDVSGVVCDLSPYPNHLRVLGCRLPMLPRDVPKQFRIDHMLWILVFIASAILTCGVGSIAWCRTRKTKLKKN